MVGYSFESALQGLVVPSGVKEGYMPVTMWSNMKVNPKGLSSYIFGKYLCGTLRHCDEKQKSTQNVWQIQP